MIKTKLFHNWSVVQCSCRSWLWKVNFIYLWQKDDSRCCCIYESLVISLQRMFTLWINACHAFGCLLVLTLDFFFISMTIYFDIFSYKPLKTNQTSVLFRITRLLDKCMMLPSCVYVFIYATFICTHYIRNLYNTT